MYEYEDAWIMTAQLNGKKDGCELCMRPLVLCKDCVHMKVMPCDIHGHIPIYCTNLGIYSEGLEWFCADGEKR